MARTGARDEAIPDGKLAVWICGGTAARTSREANGGRPAYWLGGGRSVSRRSEGNVYDLLDRRGCYDGDGKDWCCIGVRDPIAERAWNPGVAGIGADLETRRYGRATIIVKRVRPGRYQRQRDEKQHRHKCDAAIRPTVCRGSVEHHDVVSESSSPLSIDTDRIGAVPHKRAARARLSVRK